MQFLKCFCYRRTLLVLMASAFLLTFTNPIQAGVIIAGGKVSQITNIVDNIGRTWEANMTFGVSFVDVFGSGDPPATKVPAFWGDLSGATAVANVMEDQLDAYVLANGSAGIDNQQFYVAYERPAGQPTRFNAYSIFFSGSTWQEPAVVNRSGTSSLPDNGFAQFTLTGASASVPEPTSAALFVGIATVRMFRRRRR